MRARPGRWRVGRMERSRPCRRVKVEVRYVLHAARILLAPPIAMRGSQTSPPLPPPASEARAAGCLLVLALVLVLAQSRCSLMAPEAMRAMAGAGLRAACPAVVGARLHSLPVHRAWRPIPTPTWGGCLHIVPRAPLLMPPSCRCPLLAAPPGTCHLQPAVQIPAPGE